MAISPTHKNVFINSLTTFIFQKYDKSKKHSSMNYILFGKLYIPNLFPMFHIKIKRSDHF